MLSRGTTTEKRKKKKKKYIFIYIYREREGERERHVDIDARTEFRSRQDPNKVQRVSGSSKGLLHQWDEEHERWWS